MNNKITLLVFSLHHGGAEKVCLTLCNEFVRRNYDVELWIVDYTETSLTKKLDKRVSVYPLNKKHVSHSLLPLMKLFLLRKPERLLVFHIELAILAIILTKVFFLKTYVVVRSINTLSQAFDYPKNFWEKYIAKRAIRRLIMYADKIIAQSSGMKRDLIKTFRVPDSKIVIIHNPANMLSLNGTKREELPANEFLYVGRLNPQKGLTNLIEAFRIAYDQNKNITLTIVGDGAEKEKLIAFTEQSGLTEVIKFEGFKSNTEIYYARAKATLLTSNFEGFPNVLVESIAIGTPVISFDCPSGPEDIIEKGINGILVPHQNKEEFAKAILAVANNTIIFNPQDVIGSAKKFSTETIVNQYLKLIFNP